MLKRLIGAGITVALGSSILVGCGTTPGTSIQGVKSTHSIKFASKSVVAKFGHGLGWNHKGAAAIVNDLPRQTMSLGFSIQKDAGKQVDLRPLMSPVGNQGQFGSCTAFAMIKGFKEFMVLKAIRDRKGDVEREFTPLSPAFLWFNERAYTGEQAKDTGANMFLGMNMLTNYGAPPEADYPYPTPAQQEDPWFRQYFLPATPSAEVYRKAAEHKGGTVRQITKLSEVKASLSAGYPVTFGFLVFESIRKAANGGMLPIPNIMEEECWGGHATLAVGFDDARQVLILRNSWGTEWGDQGYFYMPYKFFDMDLGLVADGWTMRE